MKTETAIFTTKKLEKTISKFVTKHQTFTENNFLNNWNANIFYVNNRKCWLLVNFETKYVLVLNGIKQNNVKNISNTFKESLYNQFIYDGIILDYKLLDNLTGEIKLFSTNNNKSTLGTINDYMYHYKHWIYQYGNYTNINFKELSSKLNTSLPNTLLKYDYPKNKMLELLSVYM